MDTDPEFDLKDFQARVYEDFILLLTTHSVAKAYSDGRLSASNLQEPAEPKEPPGLFIKGLSGFLSRVGKKAEETILNDPELVAAENRATEIINRPEVKKLLCLAFRKEISIDLFREAYQVRWVRAITAALATEEAVSRFAIERDVRLFAAIGLSTWRKGVWKYCALKPASKAAPASAGLKEFQREVFNAYRSFRNSTERAERFAEKGYGSLEPKPATSWRGKLAASVINSVARAVNAWYLNLNAVLQLQKRAAEMLEREEIRDILRPRLRHLPEDAFKDELAVEVVIIMTSELTKSNIAEKFSIEKENELFAALVNQAILRGIPTYCTQ